MFLHNCFIVLLCFLSIEVPSKHPWQVVAIAFEEVSSLHIWLTVSSLANKDPNNHKSLIFRQIELNWINAPLEDNGDYLALYLDSAPENIGESLPVSVHKVNGVHSGKIITDYYLPQLDFYNQTVVNSLSRLHDRQQLKEQNSLEFQFSSQTQDESAGAHNWAHRGHQINPLQSASQKHTSNGYNLQEECIGYCVAYHSRQRILGTNCLKTRPNWMQESYTIIAPRSLPTLMIPGTHNSGTYPKQLDKSVLQMINKYQMNQDDSVFDQLVFGVRYLDLRVGYNKVKQRSERLWIYHDIFRTEVSLDELFEQVRKFLDMTTHEIIIMDFHRFTVGFQNENAQTQRERHAKLIELLFKHLGKYVIPSYLGQHAPLQEYVSLGKRLLIGYASRSQLLGTKQPDQHHLIFGLYHQAPEMQSNLVGSKSKSLPAITTGDNNETTSVKQHDELGGQHEDANNQEEDELQMESAQADNRMATRIYNKLKSLKLISHSFSKRSVGGQQGETLSPAAKSIRNNMASNNSSRTLAKLMLTPRNSDDQLDWTAQSSDGVAASVARAALFFAPVRHLWPNKDTLDGLAQYMNESTCRKYFGELRSMMVELTPTVFGAISDKYDGNRRLAQQANRPVTDWIRDRWLHCINIVASDFFLGNDLVSLAIRANKMRVLNRDAGGELAAAAATAQSAGSGRRSATARPLCRQLRKIEHLIDKNKIPIQFAYQPYPSASQGQQLDELGVPIMSINSLHKGEDMITHSSPSGNKILLRPLTASKTYLNSAFNSNGHTQSRERRDSFVDNVSEGFADLFSSFKRLFNL